MDVTPSDIALMSKSNEEGFGGGSFIWLIALLLVFGGGFGGLGNNRYADSAVNTYATAASQQEILSGQKFDSLSRQVNQTADGIASSTFSLNNAIVSEGRGIGSALQAGFANLQNCCCDLKYEMAQNFANTNANTTAQIQKVLDTMAQNQIASLQAQVSELKTQNMFCGIPRINPFGYGVYPYPVPTTTTTGTTTT